MLGDFLPLVWSPYEQGKTGLQTFFLAERFAKNMYLRSRWLLWLGISVGVDFGEGCRRSHWLLGYDKTAQTSTLYFSNFFLTLKHQSDEIKYLGVVTCPIAINLTLGNCGLRKTKIPCLRRWARKCWSLQGSILAKTYKFLKSFWPLTKWPRWNVLSKQ